VEKNEVMIIGASRRRTGVNCHQCAQPVDLVPLDDAMRLAAVNSRVIFRWIEEGRIHFAETAVGRVLVCPTSLLERVRAVKPE